MKGLLHGGLIFAALVSASTMTYAQQAGTGTGSSLKANQTAGYGDDKILTFTYNQSFQCTDQPQSDLNFNGVKAKSDPNEFQIPICQAGNNPTINPPGMTGKATNTTDPIFVLIPMFSVGHDTNPDDAISCTGVVPGTICGQQLGQALIQFFGALPEAFKQNPAVYTQCPNPGEPAGTCTMHASRVDLAPVLAALGKISSPPTSNVFVPSPNHSHVLLKGQINQSQEWWQVIPVLVMDHSDWPTKEGKSGITSVAKMNSAIAAGRAQEVPSNFFLYFGSQVSQMGQMKM